MIGQVVDTGTPNFFWRAHTVTVLLVLICCLVYKGVILYCTVLYCTVLYYTVQRSDRDPGGGLYSKWPARLHRLPLLLGDLRH